MRLDLFLKKTRIIKSRAKSRAICKKGRVRLNNTIAKPEKYVKAEDIINIDFGKRILEIKITSIPQGNVSKRKAPSYYKVIRNEKIDII
jgi:ribosomal 50S subunit-recycling heat shock protein